MGTSYSSTYSDLKENLENSPPVVSESKSSIDQNPNEAEVILSENIRNALVRENLVTTLTSRPDERTPCSCVSCALPTVSTPSEPVSPKEVYVITGERTLGYAQTFEEAKAFVDSAVANNLIGHYLNHRTVEKEINECPEPSYPTSAVYIATVFERFYNLFLSHREVLCQYIIWRTMPL